jgi:hypothetical protein
MRSDKAPSCGCNKKEVSPLWLVLFLCVSVFSGVGYPYAKKIYMKAAGPEYIIEAKALYNEFSDNELRATEKYKGKRVQVSGTYSGNGSAMGSSWVMLNSGVLFSDVQCLLAKSDVAFAADLSTGRKVSLVGKVDGKLGAVVLSECKFNR